MERDFKRLERDYLIYKGVFVSLVVLSLIGVIVAIIVGVLSMYDVNNYNHPVSIYSGGILPGTPYVYHLEGSGSPVIMTLPNDLSDRVGNVYRVHSLTNQPHEITITGTGTTFDGVSTKAIFGGSIGDGFTYEVISKNRIVLGVVNNVIFI